MKTKILIFTNILTAIALLYCVIIYSGILDSRDNTATYPIKNSTARDLEATFYYLDVLENERIDYSKETRELAPMTETISGHDVFDLIKERYRFVEIKEGETIVLTYSIPKEFNRKYTLDVHDNPLRIEVAPETEWRKHLQDLEKKKSNSSEENISPESSQLLGFILPKLFSIVVLSLLFLGVIKKTIDLRTNKKMLKTKAIFTILLAIILGYLFVIASNFHLPSLFNYQILAPVQYLSNLDILCSSTKEYCISKIILFTCLLIAYLSSIIYLTLEFVLFIARVTTKYKVNWEVLRSFLYTILISLFSPFILLLFSLHTLEKYEAFFHAITYIPRKAAQLSSCPLGESFCILDYFLFILTGFTQLWLLIFSFLILKKFLKK